MGPTCAQWLSRASFNDLDKTAMKTQGLLHFEGHGKGKGIYVSGVESYKHYNEDITPPP